MLPWLVNGRLSSSDKQRFERHLLDCAECRSELEAQRAICDRMRDDQPVMLAPQASLQKLMARIDGAPSAASQSVAKISERAREPRRVPRWLAIAAAVQSIAIAGLLMLVWQQRDAELNAPRYTTLSTPSAALARGAALRIVFRDDMTNEELQTLLRSVDAQVIAGPTEAGVYTVRLAIGENTDDITRALESVRTNSKVVFAEHISMEPAR